MEKVIGFLNGFHDTDTKGNFTGTHLGAKVAYAELLDNIITHGGYEWHHFLYDVPPCDPERLARYVEFKRWDPRRLLVFRGALPLDRIAREEYHVLFRPDCLIDFAMALRNALARPLAPAVGLIHTLSYADEMPLWIQLLLSNALPCDALVCSSSAAKEGMERTFNVLSERLSRRLGGKTAVFRGQLPIIPLGVDVDYWVPEGDKTAVRRQMGLPENTRIILCAARFSSWDKMDLRPFLMVVRQLLPVLGADFFRVICVGDNVRENEAEQIRSFVESLGLSQVVTIDTDGTPSTVRRYYRVADIFVSLADNLQETFGLTVIQAMACGLPTIVSDWDGYKDTVLHGETGYRIPTYWAQCDRQISHLGTQRPWWIDHLLLAQSVAVDTGELLDALHLLITSPNLCHQLGEAGRRRAVQMYAWPVVIKQYKELWQECQERFVHLDAQDWTIEEDGALLTPAYFRQFSHYASAIISSNTQLALRPTRSSVIFNEVSDYDVRLPDPMKKVFDPAVFECFRWRLQEWPVTMSELVDAVGRETKHAEDQVTRHLMWLVKYGVVEPVHASANTQSVLVERAGIETT